MTNQQIEQTPASTAARAAILRMGQAWQSMGLINQAIYAYSRILTRYPGSLEAREATEGLTGLAQSYEHEGQFRLAMGLYDKLELLS